MEQSKLLAILVSTAGVSVVCAILFVGLPDSTYTVGTYSKASLVSTGDTAIQHAPRPRFVPSASVAADVATDVSGETATSSIDTDAHLEPVADDTSAPSAAEVPVVVTKVPVVKKVVTPNASKKSDSSTPTEFERTIAQKIHALTNAERQKQGLDSYTYDTALAGPAYAYSVVMQTQNFFSHTDPNGCGMTCRFAKTKYSALAWGENLALWKSSYAPSADEVAEYFVREWKKSAGHRDNLFSTVYTNEGIGVAVVGNKILVTVRFAEPK